MEKKERVYKRGIFVAQITVVKSVYQPAQSSEKERSLSMNMCS